MKARCKRAIENIQLAKLHLSIFVTNLVPKKKMPFASSYKCSMTNLKHVISYKY